nr:hypothetical protein [Porphyromonas gulae]
MARLFQDSGATFRRFLARKSSSYSS